MPIETMPVTPTEQDISAAREANKQLSKVAARGGRARLLVCPPGDLEVDVPIPPPAFQLLLNVMEEMGKGHSVVVSAALTEVTTQQAADYLVVSRPYLISELLDTGKIRYRMVGNRRRIRVDDLVQYKQVEEEEIARREAAMHELMAETKRLGLYR